MIEKRKSRSKYGHQDRLTRRFDDIVIGIRWKRRLWKNTEPRLDDVANRIDVTRRCDRP